MLGLCVHCLTDYWNDIKIWKRLQSEHIPPMKFEEFESKIRQIVFVSATPSKYELDNSYEVIEQIIRPTGLLDPLIEVKPSNGQIDDLIKENAPELLNHIPDNILSKQMVDGKLYSIPNMQQSHQGGCARDIM